MAFTTKDSGKRIDFQTGSRRDTEDGKPRYDLIGTWMLRSLATFLGEKAPQYDAMLRAVCAMARGEPYDEAAVAELNRLAELLERGAKKYGEHNWALGQPTSRSFSSWLRHAMQFAEGDTSEDHLAATIFNAMSIIHVEAEVVLGNLPVELLDHPRYRVAGKTLWEKEQAELGEEDDWLILQTNLLVEQGWYLVGVHGTLFVLPPHTF